MSHRTKIIDFIKKLESAYPESDLISIREHFDKHIHNQSTDYYYEVYVQSVGHSIHLHGMLALEERVEAFVLNSGVTITRRQCE